MQEKNVTRAGHKLHLSQSAVSAALGRLRTLFDDRLFERSPSGMTPTPKALSLSLGLGPSLSTIASVILDDAEFDPWQSTRTFHLAMSDDVEMVFAPWFARQKVEHNWAVNIAIHQTNSTLWRQSIDEQIIDLVVSTTPDHVPSDVRSEPLFSGDYRCLYNPRVLELSDPLGSREYIETRHVRVSYDLQRGWVDDVLGGMGHQRNSLCTISHFSGLGPLLVELPVIATVPEHVAMRIAGVFDMRTSAVPIPMPRFTISAIWKAEVDDLVENQWIRHQCARFVQANNL